MQLEEIKRKTNPFKLSNTIIILVIVIIFLNSWSSTNMDIASLLDGWKYMNEYIKGNENIENSGFFPPNTDFDDIKTYALSMLETIQMAVVALVLSIILAVPLSYMSSRNILNILIPGNSIFHLALKKSIYAFATLIANIFRSINEIVWALIFVSAVGLGPMAGILALGVHTAGVLSKLLSEGNESIDPGPVEALTTTGASFFKVLVYAVIPQTMPHFISMVLYRFESDVRSASILGFVGAGGIGFYLFDKIRAFENGDVCTIIIIIVISVWIFDKISAKIRERFI
ncbi:phosphonate ABC transporter, permease protein PhnE [Malaciobacter mytili]|uniref:Phosphonate ABC transporter, permease protein PhnE n=1 Tax=Malaciobacter mytili LMG 24559 TaxID=1032238 RepID=A0AAX2ADX8_9BACT|nr:phosphonate ABC transporter, permease protein PhnE [Malaciobacter mytili]AXH14969.1 phosphonate ABC transporter, permease protein [Malaciobacter mytili LMG 24559]RXK12399.1 phosphonate ABC transporter, permease protein PhnE [Malaciobacter mytili LMG 24559]